MSLFTKPLTIAIETVKTDYPLDLCDLQSDPLYKGRIETGLDFFKLLGDRFSKLTHFGLKIGSMMGSMYLCESPYSIMHFLKPKYRSSLSDNSFIHGMRLATTNVEIDINIIVKDKF